MTYIVALKVTKFGAGQLNSFGDIQQKLLGGGEGEHPLVQIGVKVPFCEKMTFQITFGQLKVQQPKNPETRTKEVSCSQEPTFCLKSQLVKLAKKLRKCQLFGTNLYPNK